MCVMSTYIYIYLFIYLYLYTVYMYIFKVYTVELFPKPENGLAQRPRKSQAL